MTTSWLRRNISATLVRRRSHSRLVLGFRGNLTPPYWLSERPNRLHNYLGLCARQCRCASPFSDLGAFLSPSHPIHPSELPSARNPRRFARLALKHRLHTASPSLSLRPMLVAIVVEFFQIRRSTDLCRESRRGNPGKTKTKNQRDRDSRPDVYSRVVLSPIN